ncbi:hypothetical protein FNV43_RR09148 [Rhamnella rubrinervis]|uniref:VTT domain-containing protein n=1 Tax=Rhamnella rubrinervis TaxID=2594499 RepID=A0A8K0H9Z2_9ROSA|nr:hypothetical protein FNV43_RR09148 [Rhamnella rubrinervis]
MTYYEEDGRGEVAPQLGLRIGGDGNNGDYVKLEEGLDAPLEPSTPRRGGALWYWFRFVLLLVCLGLLAWVFLTWVGPFFMDKEIIPLINWETATFTTPVLAILVFASVAVFPTLLLPSTPSMWVAGMTFGYGFGFLLIIVPAAIGISLPYFIGSLFCHKIQGWLDKYPKRASILRLAGEGNWFHQFRAVTLIRISPFPYIIYNYCAVTTHVKYGPYLLGSLVGMVPEIFVAIYTGILIKTLADASHEHRGLSAPQIIFTVVGFCATVATTIFITMYAKRKLKELQMEDELLLQ